ncbi:MAG: DUF3362 domain-containing protein, partial [Oscillospiraceae bacterium]|nr:DUF3362 domain-containing protein [Oscillospiraceae bacterium]
PYTMEPVYVPRTPEEKAMQRALLQYFLPKNKPLVAKALIMAQRRDLIGYGKDCLITPADNGRDRRMAPAKGKTAPSHGAKETRERNGKKSIPKKQKRAGKP